MKSVHCDLSKCHLESHGSIAKHRPNSKYQLRHCLTSVCHMQTTKLFAKSKSTAKHPNQVEVKTHTIRKSQKSNESNLKLDQMKANSETATWVTSLKSIELLCPVTKQSCRYCLQDIGTIFHRPLTLWPCSASPNHAESMFCHLDGTQAHHLNQCLLQHKRQCLLRILGM